MPDIEHPEKYDKVKPWKRKRTDPPVELSDEDKKIAAFDKKTRKIIVSRVDPGEIILDDLSGAEEE